MPFGGSPPPPPPSGNGDPFPIDKMDRALDATIRLFTRVLDQAGIDCGRLAIRGGVPADVGGLLADCTTYRAADDGSMTYLSLGVTPDFEQFMYPPHCRLFLILNAVGICEDPFMAGSLDGTAHSQLPEVMVDTWLLRAWLPYIVRTGDARRQGEAALHDLLRSLRRDLVAVADRVPQSWRDRLRLDDSLNEFGTNYPGTIGRRLEPSTPRMNGLPMSPFIEQTLTAYLARATAAGAIEEQRRRREA